MYSGEIDKAIATRIRERRAETGITLRECARAVGVSTNQYKKYESGKNRITAGRLLRIAAFLGVEVSDLFDGIDEGVVCPLIDPLEPFVVRDELMALDPKTRRAVRQIVRAAGEAEKAA